jgi:hypothetical protein
LSGPNSVGIFVASDKPEPFGPRNRDQSVGAADNETGNNSASNATLV